jgi:formate-dependent nitrite reductase membrane component NrfD
MNTSQVTKDGITNARPGSEATTGVVSGRKRRDRDVMVPEARFDSYYGKPVINKPVWSSSDIAGYLFLGGLAGASSLLGAGGHFTRRSSLARASKVAAAGAGALSIVALVHDLGRPARFLNMLRVFKMTSPMSIGSWLLSAYVPAAITSAVSEVTGTAPRIGTVATTGAAALGPAVAAYTAALISDTAVPAWHDGHREMPFVFVSSAASAAGGMGLLASALEDNEPARRLGMVGGLLEISVMRLMERRMHSTVAEAYRSGKAKTFVRGAEVLTGAGVIGTVLAARTDRLAAAATGAALLAGSACARFGIFFAGEASAMDPAATITPQRERLIDR